MAQIAPFRGVLYDTTQVDASAVLAPPYDAIDERARGALAERHPANCVRLIAPEGEAEAKYDNAAATYQSWLADGTLLRDQRPAIYRYHHSFTAPGLDGRRVTRHGFIAMVRLHAYGEGVVRPHARTQQDASLDQLQLMRSTRAHLSPVFALYSDPSQRSDEVFKRLERSTEPCLYAKTDDGAEHTLWRICDAETIGKLTRVVAPLNVYIADGHNRYEAMLEWRDELREQTEGGLGTWSAGEFATLLLCNIDDTGLAVAPVHRLVHGLPELDAGRALAAMGEYFDVTPIEGGAKDVDRIRGALQLAGGDRTSFVVALAGRDDTYMLTAKGSLSLTGLGLSGSRVLSGLDVTLLHELVLGRCLGLTREVQDAHANLSYLEDLEQAVARVASGEAQGCFVLRPTRVAQLRAVADAGELMPPKSIAFYPKIPSGLVFSPIDPNQDLR